MQPLSLGQKQAVQHTVNDFAVQNGVKKQPEDVVNRIETVVRGALPQNILSGYTGYGLIGQ
jgi:hypothetical protein